MARECTVVRQSGYTVMSNHHLRDKTLGLKAKGLLSVILSLPEDWDYSIRGLAKICDCGRDAIGAALTELEKAGYITRERQRTEDGKLAGTAYIIREFPEIPAGERQCESAQPMPDFPAQGNPAQEKPAQENPPQLNTKDNQLLNDKKGRRTKGGSHVLDDVAFDGLVMQYIGTLGDANRWGRDEKNGIYLLVKEFYGDRECSGKPPAHTARGLGGLFRKLAPEGKCTYAQAADMLLTAIERGWTSVYPREEQGRLGMARPGTGGGALPANLGGDME